MSELCKGGEHVLKLLTGKNLLPNIYGCAMCTLVLIPTDAMLSTYKDIRAELQEIIYNLDEGEKDYKEFLKDNHDE